MTRWRLDLIRSGGPRDIVHISVPIALDGAGRWTKLGELRCTPAEYADLQARLAEPVIPTAEPATRRYTCTRCGQPGERGTILCSACLAGTDLHEGVPAVSTADLGLIEPRADMALAGLREFPCCEQPDVTEGPDIVAPDGSVQ